MHTLGIIPARYGSTRLQGKPLIGLCGKPMIQRVYEQAKKALEHVVVATDDSRVEKAVLEFGGNVVMTSTKHNTGTNRCLEAYEMYKAKANENFDIVINIQGDEPLLDPKQLRLIISCFTSADTQMATLVIPLKKQDGLNNGVFVVMDKNHNALYFSRSIIPFVRDVEKSDWIKKHTFYKHIGLYGFTPNALKTFANMQQTSLEIAESLEQNRWLENGNKIKVAITKIDTVGVDTMEDVERVKQMIKNKHKF
ncbi:MAG: 3-deoxy-manno-octulosonate cytidylyltransferase [Flavobacteriales bacterium]|nr:MAG: 3-deoxy-manno-octulosonate cytidylyltransferase [Flavobacteriales bacterium]